MIDIDALEKLWGPHKKYPLVFMDHPEVNVFLDAFPILLAEVRAARGWLEKENVLDESAKGATTPYCGEDEFLAAQAAREAYRELVEGNRE